MGGWGGVPCISQTIWLMSFVREGTSCTPRAMLRYCYFTFKLSTQPAADLLSILTEENLPLRFFIVVQDLHLILSLVATLLRNQPQLADPLLAVTIDYNNNQKVDWVDIIIAALNVLPGLAARAATEHQHQAAYTQLFAGPSSGGQGGGSSGSDGGRFAWSVLNSLADCLSATAAAAACQPSRVLTALCR